MRRFLLILTALIFGCGPPVEDAPDSTAEASLVTCPGEGDYPHADQIVEAPGQVDTPSAVNEPKYAVDGVVSGDPKSGSTRVFSRGTSTEPPNNYVIVTWSGRRVVDAEGPDLVVFENPFETQGGVFMDPAIVSVSAHGEHWIDFPHDYLADDEEQFSLDPSHWEGFAGITPVRWDSSTCTNPFDRSAGGDRFDLADLADPSLTDGIRFVKLTAAPTVENPDTGEVFPKYFISDGFDLDGVYAAATTTP